MYKNSIRKYRKEKGLKLEEMSIKIGISTGYLCHLERGTRKNPSREVMERISKALQKSIAEVFFEESDE
ncbi:MAG: helix-turn-helix transcriptional regulator [Clostridia bacterium]|nr:helix-turn-helix transcriptional regulator [Clostridia bacterium]